VTISDAEGNTQAWKICDLETGKVEPVNLPVPTSEVAMIALRDDRTVLWLTGSPPLDKGNNRVDRRSALPESGEFPHPGKPYVLWSWKINSADPPARLYAAGTQWLEWSLSDRPDRLEVGRVSESRPARVEHVALDLTQSPPAESPISDEEMIALRARQDRSFDGRFALKLVSAGRFVPECIVDTKAGRRFGMQSGALAFRAVSLWWSPTAHKFILEAPEVKLAAGGWRWPHSAEEIYESALVVYFVDMDSQ